MGYTTTAPVNNKNRYIPPTKTRPDLILFGTSDKPVMAKTVEKLGWGYERTVHHVRELAYAGILKLDDNSDITLNPYIIDQLSHSLLTLEGWYTTTGLSTSIDNKHTAYLLRETDYGKTDRPETAEEIERRLAVVEFVGLHYFSHCCYCRKCGVLFFFLSHYVFLIKRKFFP